MLAKKKLKIFSPVKSNCWCWKCRRKVCRNNTLTVIQGGKRQCTSWLDGAPVGSSWDSWKQLLYFRAFKNRCCFLNQINILNFSVCMYMCHDLSHRIIFLTKQIVVSFSKLLWTTWAPVSVGVAMLILTFSSSWVLRCRSPIENNQIWQDKKQLDEAKPSTKAV